MAPGKTCEKAGTAFTKNVSPIRQEAALTYFYLDPYPYSYS
jgi:hypothetical protein